MSSLSVQSAPIQDQALTKTGEDLSLNNFPPAQNRDSVLNNLSITNVSIEKINDLSKRFPFAEFSSVEEGARELARGNGNHDFLRISSEISEVLMANNPLPGDARRCLERAQREATSLAGTDPADSLTYLSRYNFLAYHCEKALEATAQPLALAA